jgi:hypothetical protein
LIKRKKKKSKSGKAPHFNSKKDNFTPALFNSKRQSYAKKKPVQFHSFFYFIKSKKIKQADQHGFVVVVVVVVVFCWLD